MRPLPHLLALSDDRVAALDDLGVRSAAIAAAGPAVALVARRPTGTTDQLATLAVRFVANAAPPMASVLVTGRVDVALATGAQGVVLRAPDLEIGDVRAIARDAAARRTRDRRNRVAQPLVILRSVHSENEARRAIDDNADGLIAGPVWETATHPGRAAMGISFLTRITSLGVPTFAIGGVTTERADQVRDAGAWGIAAITALWDAKDPYRAAMEMITRLAR